MTLGRIDTHTHVVPPLYLEWLRSHPQHPSPLIEWSKESALDFFGRVGIETGILSVSTPGIRLGAEDADQAAAVARGVNEFCAELVRDDPQHFGFFATLVLPDLEAALEEAEYAFDQLHADGVCLLTNAEGTYLGAPEWDPLMELLNERSAVVFVHPTALPTRPVPGITPGVIDFLADSTRAAANLVKHDCLDRFSNLKVLLSHGGGYLPYAASRMAAGISMDAEPEVTMKKLKAFYLDTALTGGPYALPSLCAFCESDHLTFGSDWPYEARANQSIEFTRRLDAYPMPDDQRHALNRGNAERLFPRLAG
jgi:predicted TIM-barrel fold metal-dependent hydrolase